jgi:hypothetical protein
MAVTDLKRCTSYNKGIWLQEFNIAHWFCRFVREGVHVYWLGLSFKRNILYNVLKNFCASTVTISAGSVRARVRVRTGTSESLLISDIYLTGAQELSNNAVKYNIHVAVCQLLYKNINQFMFQTYITG